MQNKRKNPIIDQAFYETGLQRYVFAAYLNVSEQTLFRRLRMELPEDEQKEYAGLIRKCAAQIQR